MSLEVEYVVYNESVTNESFSSLLDPEGLLQKWVLFSIPFQISILLFYFVFVLKLGPMYMENKRPYELKTIMRIYNILQICYNLSILYHCLTPRAGYFPLSLLAGISCSSLEPEVLEEFRELILHACWHLLLLKTLDLLDTVFMVLRKKTSHVTFLHVYHHAGTVFFVWVSIRFMAAIQGAIPVIINLLVHTIMYSYYFLTTFSAFKKYLWWKHHLTKLQLVQFVVIMVYLSGLYYHRCPVPRSLTYLWLINVFIIFCLFLNFYIQAYIVKGKDSNKKNKVK